MTASARRAEPPRLDVRKGVRAALERELRHLRKAGGQVGEGHWREALLALFSRPMAGIGLGLGLAAVSLFALLSARSVDPVEAEVEAPPVFEESYVIEEDWIASL